MCARQSGLVAPSYVIMREDGSVLRRAMASLLGRARSCLAHRDLINKIKLSAVITSQLTESEDNACVGWINRN